MALAVAPDRGDARIDDAVWSLAEPGDALAGLFDQRPGRLPGLLGRPVGQPAPPLESLRKQQDGHEGLVPYSSNIGVRSGEIELRTGFRPPARAGS